MDHHEAERYLLDFASGALDRSVRNAVIAHVENCVDCRAWLETYDLFAGRSATDPGSDHPNSEFLSLCTVCPEEINEPENSTLREHLDGCASCQREVKLVREAVQAARPEVPCSTKTVLPRPSYPWWRLAAAACVAALALGLFFAAETRNPERAGVRFNDSEIAIDERRQRWPGASVEEIFEKELGGTRLIEVEGSLALNRVKIKNGARITILAGDVITIGNGFQVGSLTRVTVGTN